LCPCHRGSWFVNLGLAWPGLADLVGRWAVAWLGRMVRVAWLVAQVSKAKSCMTCAWLVACLVHGWLHDLCMVR
jgi:hypothetical protein